MPRPTLIFVPGAWHTPEVFTAVISRLEPLGYKCIGHSNPAVAHKPAVKDLQPDITALREAVLKEIDSGNDVVVVSHSWSGIVAGSALDGLGKSHREERGEKGGVVRIVFMCAFVAMEGVSLFDSIGRTPSDLWDVKEPWLHARNPEAAFYHDLEPEQAAYWSSKLLPHSHATNFAPATGAAWKTIPSTYLVCEDDRAIPAFRQDAIVKACQEAGAPMVVERIFSSHSPFLAKPDETVGVVRRAAGESV